MTLMPEDFHFLRPEWFYALIPLVLAVWFIKRWRSKATGWQGVIAGHLYQFLVTGEQRKIKSAFVPLLALTWLLSVIALAGPVWERIPQPVYQVKAGHVIVMDMSMSMRATDISPDRLSRAKYKAIDLVNLIDEGDMGLVAYAGDAFVISPLTQDANTLTSLLPSLSPEIMPNTGSEPVTGLKLAEELLTNAGFQQGILYWITDGVEISQMKELSDFLSQTPFAVNVLAVGTEEGAPIKQLNGELLKRSNGSIVVPKLNGGALKQLSRQGGGKYAQISADDSDIKYLATASRFNNRETLEDDNDNQGDKWREAGPYLLLLLLPLAAFAFKRGLIFAAIISFNFMLTAPPVSAQENAPSAVPAPAVPWWKKPFLNDDQQGLAAYEAEQFADAAGDFDDPAWRGAAQYRNGEFEAAAQSYAALNTAQGFYNQGNALAKAGQLDEAIAAYEQALARQPAFPAAEENKALVESLKQQQEQQEQQQNQQSDDQQQNEDQQQQQDQQNGESQENEQDSQSGEQNNQEQQNGQQNAEQDQQQQQNEASEGEQEDQQGEQEQQSSENTEQQQKEAEQQEAQQASAEQTERDRETQQRLNNLLRRIPDDPSFLLKRKMQLEAQKRQYNRPPNSDRSDW